VLLVTRVLLAGFGFKLVSKPDEFLNIIPIRSVGPVNSAGPGFRSVPYEYSNYSSNPKFEPELPTAYDYHIVVVSKEAVGYVPHLLSAKKDDFAYLMNAPFPGILVAPIIGGNHHYSDWVPNIDKLKERGGDQLKLREKHWLYHILNRHLKNLSWRAHGELQITSYDDSLAQRFIATNITDNPVSFECPMGNGRTIFLPFYDFGSDELEAVFLRELLDAIESRYKISDQKAAPSWASKPNYRLPSEDLMNEQAKEIEQAKTVLNQVKSILWLDGIELVNSVAQTLKRLGIRCEVKEKEGRHDIEIQESELHGIMEVKGSSGYPNAEGVRQLLDWHMEAMNQDENVKGIFLVNDFRDIEPDLRRGKMLLTVKDGEYPFTKDVVRVAKNNQFCLLTCYQLFQIFKLYSEGKFVKEAFLRKVKDTNGVYSLP
jgi:hypothetical protein